MKFRRILEILRLRRSPAQIESETRHLQSFEKEIGAKEIVIIKTALKFLDKICALSGYGNDAGRVKGWVAVYPRHFNEFEGLLSELQGTLLDLKARSKSIIAIKERIESNLLRAREGTKKDRNRYLSQAEGRLLEFAEAIEEHIEYAVQQVKLLGDQDISGLENVGYLEPKDHHLGGYARAIIGDIEKSLHWIHLNLSRLFELDKK